MRRAVLAGLVGCAGACGMAPSDPDVTLRFTADPGPTGSERYVCFGFDASVLRGAAVGAIALEQGAGRSRSTTSRCTRRPARSRTGRSTA